MFEKLLQADWLLSKHKRTQLEHAAFQRDRCNIKNVTTEDASHMFGCLKWIYSEHLKQEKVILAVRTGA